MYKEETSELSTQKEESLDNKKNTVLAEYDNELDIRNQELFFNSLQKVDNLVMKRYLPVISQLEVAPINEELYNKDLSNYLRFFKINKIALDKNENNQLKLSSVFNSIYSINASVITIIDSVDGNIDFYIGVKSLDDKLLHSCEKVLDSSLRGIFTGTDIEKINNIRMKEVINKITSNDKVISSCSTISGIKKIDIKDEKNSFTQGIEKIIDSTRGLNDNYTIVIISDPVSTSRLNEIKSGYEDIYSSLSIFKNTGLSLQKNTSDSTSQTHTSSTSDSTSRTNTYGTTSTVSKNFTQGTANTTSTTTTHGTSDTTSYSTTESTTKSKTKSYSHTNGSTKPSGKTIATNIVSNVASIGLMMFAGPVIGRGLSFLASGLISGVAQSFGSTESFSDTIGYSDTDSVSNSQTSGKAHTTFNSTSEGLANTISNSIGTGFSQSGSFSHARGKTHTDGYSDSKGTTQTDGRAETINLTSENKKISNILDELDKQLLRLKECEDVGVWNTSTYIINGNAERNRVISSLYQALIRGEDSSIESCAINLWSLDNNNKENVLKYISKMYHPEFIISNDYPLVSPAVNISSLEMAIQAGLPEKSVPGLPAISYTPFSREVVSYDNIDCSKAIDIGNIFHFGKEDENNKVKLDLNSLSSHTFITGSTGSGKSNTVYHIISEFIKNNINFMVIEPAKGEYKNIFGNRSDVSVYGTNPYFTDLLRINPFSFNTNIHVLEHIDRLIEIFNVCWPMYAAMPSVLKESIEMAYINAGWDLDLSTNRFKENIFPTFFDILEALKYSINNSDFSQEVKSNYIGALVTRVKSLTNGIIGRIFNSNEIAEEDLFDKNVIIDLSRVGSSETKSLIMGILIMKLSEYRSLSKMMNSSLKHVTILEEAHNILKRTSTEQNMESSNLVGKSVEMISNSIAEMRTYGEGFIIVDQSPSAVDMSAIRNTNTKIILRLPEYSDREVVGRASSLNDEQIDELSKLQTGVACVYQNNWCLALLSKINKFNNIEYYYEKKDETFFKEYYNNSLLLKVLAQIKLNEKLELKEEDIKEIIGSINATVETKLKIKDIINKNEINSKDLSRILSNLFDINFIKPKLKNLKDIVELNHILINFFFKDGTTIDDNYINELLSCFIENYCSENTYNNWLNYFYKGNIK